MTPKTTHPMVLSETERTTPPTLHHLPFPAGWHELTPAELRALVELLLTAAEQGEEAYYIRIHFLLILLCGTPNDTITDIHHPRTLAHHLPPHEVMELADRHLPWLFDPTGQHLTPRFLIDPRRTTARTTHATGWTAMPYGTFLELQLWAAQIEHHRSEALTQIAQLLWGQTLTDESNHLLAYLWYCSMMAFFAHKFPRLFGSGTQAKTDPAALVRQQQQLLHTLADGSLTRIADVRSAPLYDALYTLEFQLEKQEQQQSQINQQR